MKKCNCPDAPKWIDVKDRLPQDRIEFCLCFNGDAPKYNQHVFQTTWYMQTKKFVLNKG